MTENFWKDKDRKKSVWEHTPKTLQSGGTWGKIFHKYKIARC